MSSMKQHILDRISHKWIAYTDAELKKLKDDIVLKYTHNEIRSRSMTISNLYTQLRDLTNSNTK